ncbi:hypothetical protein M8C21_020093 [Ambrosia artemisiifolia]|uniref:Uncharacterized protein n=1 Tax=Ambrosia artemisiifolia TaxID=4212 RepID=A0AAD5CKA0_AMBAR|nr:hypothetical protein M8C21_020093 [Ambrosia artemisiifolia]
MYRVVSDVEFKAVLFCHTMANAPPDLLKGLVDSNTLPFNVYGDMLQQHSSLKTIKSKTDELHDKEKKGK